MKLIKKLGIEGDKIGELNRPSGICCDFENRIIVCESGNNRISIFNLKYFEMMRFSFLMGDYFNDEWIWYFQFQSFNKYFNLLSLLLITLIIICKQLELILLK